MRKIIRFMKRVAISGMSALLKCGISITLVTALLTKRLLGPGTFQAGLELYEVAGPAGLYLIKLKVGHWFLAFILEEITLTKT